MAGWDGEANWNCDVLERIAALLFALANLADLAAGASYCRRRKVLQILSHGEVEARAFLFGGTPVPADALEEAGDAARLAARFRSLALVLCMLMAQAAPFALPGAVGSQARGLSQKMPGRAFRRPDARALPAPDTS